MGQQRHQMQNGDAERPETMRQERKCDRGAGSKKVDDEMTCVERHEIRRNEKVE